MRGRTAWPAPPRSCDPLEPEWQPQLGVVFHSQYVSGGTENRKIISKEDPHESFLLMSQCVWVWHVASGCIWQVPTVFEKAYVQPSCLASCGGHVCHAKRILIFQCGSQFQKAWTRHGAADFGCPTVQVIGRETVLKTSTSRASELLNISTHTHLWANHNAIAVNNRHWKSV